MIWTTEIMAVDPHNEENLYIYEGPMVEAETLLDAQQWCDDNMGYCKVTGRYLEPASVDLINREN